jgi:hypothetical protein
MLTASLRRRIVGMNDDSITRTLVSQSVRGLWTEAQKYGEDDEERDRYPAAAKRWKVLEEASRCEQGNTIQK